MSLHELPAARRVSDKPAAADRVFRCNEWTYLNTDMPISVLRINMAGNIGEYDYPSTQGQGCGTEVEKCEKRCPVCGGTTRHEHVCIGCGKLAPECTCK